MHTDMLDESHQLFASVIFEAQTSETLLKVWSFAAVAVYLFCVALHVAERLS